MSSVVEIEQAIAHLSRREFAELSRWFDEERNRKWDRQIEVDAETGRLDRLWAKAEKEIEQGGLKPLDGILDDV